MMNKEEEDQGRGFYEGWPEEQEEDYQIFRDLFEPEMGEWPGQQVENDYLKGAKPYLDRLTKHLSDDDLALVGVLIHTVRNNAMEAASEAKTTAFRAGWYIAKDFGGMKELRRGYDDRLKRGYLLEHETPDHLNRCWTKDTREEVLDMLYGFFALDPGPEVDDPGGDVVPLKS
jgi:hypothetical protein